MRPKPELGASGVGNPGPGTYDTSGKAGHGPKYSMRVKPETHYNSMGPGPGAYDENKEPISHKNPSWRIGTELRGKDGYDNSNPGPGQYEDKRALSTKGTRFPKDHRGMSMGSSANPGPGNYMIQSDIETGIKNKKGKTFGLKTSQYSQNTYPAPGSYEQDVRTVRPAAAKYKFGTATRDSENKNFNPSPVDYQAKDNFVKQSAPVWGMGSGPQRGEAVTSVKNNPGPGTYEPGLQNGKPKYTFGLKTSIEFGDKPPGPGTYDPLHVYTKEKHASAKIGTSQRGHEGSFGGTPGPGQYFDQFNSGLKKKGTSFGKENRGQTVGHGKAPGPGTYELSYNYAKNPTAKTFGYKLHNSLNHSQLGPGSYDPNVATVRRNADSKSFGVSRAETGNRNVNPGPGTYENLMNKTTPAWRMGTGARGKLVGSNLEFPGPGTYTPSHLGKKYQFAYGVKLSGGDRNCVPGPGAYEPTSEYVKESGPKYKIGTETRGSGGIALTGNPGPGQYELDRRMKQKGTKFGSGMRIHAKTTENPGPGNYNLPKVTGHMANYYPQGAKIPSYD